MNLLYSLTSYPPSIGGAQLLQHHTAIKLSGRHSIQVVTHWDSNRSDWLLGTTLRANNSPHEYVIDGIPVHRIGQTRLEKFRQLPSIFIYYPLMELALRPICAILQEKLWPYASGVDIIHNVRIGREGISVASCQIARELNIPFVLTPVHHPRWTGWRHRVFRRLYREADALIALTEAEKEILIELGADERRVYVTGFGPILAQQAHPGDFRSQNNVDGPLILFLGQHYGYKGYLQLLRAAPFVWERFPETTFAFIGRSVGRSEDEFDAIRDERILRLGEVDLQTKTNALAACTLLCVPSTQESFGGVYTEAWSFSKPVIGCNIPAVSEVITDSKDGLLVPQEPRAIADAICQITASPSLAKMMGEAGNLKVKERYGWDRLAELTEQAYFDILGISSD